MGKLKSLAGDTVIYGVSTILGRMLNWLLMPFYIRTISQHDYGEVVVVYSVIAILLVVATLGFETGYFRFVNADNKHKLVHTLSSAVLAFGLMLTATYLCFPSVFMSLCGVTDSSLLLFALLIVIVDAYNAIFFAQLRYERQSLKYSLLRFFQVVVTVVLNLFFLLWLNDKVLFGIDFSAMPDVCYILIANLLGSLSSTIYLLPSICSHYSIDLSLLKRVFVYSFPLVGMGFLGNANQQIEKFLMLALDTHSDVHAQIAIYGANYKIGILMAIFTQSFRLAFEPFFFKENGQSSKTEIYAQVMKYFVYFGLVIYAGVMFFMPLVNIMLKPEYYEGNVVIPIILLAQLFFGVYYSLSMWYKAIDKTYYGVIMSFVGLSVNVVCNVLMIPSLGYFGAALSTLIGYFVMMVLSLYLGNKYYPINYPLKKLSVVCLAVLLFVQIVNYLAHNYAQSLWFILSAVGFVVVVLSLLKIENLSPKMLLKYAKRRN